MLHHFFILFDWKFIEKFQCLVSIDLNSLYLLHFIKLTLYCFYFGKENFICGFNQY